MGKAKQSGGSGELVKFPGAYARLKRELGARMVSCEISSRWLEFPEVDKASTGDFVFVAVMTLDQEERPRKLCELCLKPDDIASALLTITKR